MSEHHHDTVRVFVNGKGVDVARDATVLDAVRALDASAADEIARGDRAISDSRGLPAAPTDLVHGGAIFRLVAARKSAGDSPMDTDGGQ